MQCFCGTYAPSTAMENSRRCFWAHLLKTPSLQMLEPDALVSNGAEIDRGSGSPLKITKRSPCSPITATSDSRSTHLVYVDDLDCHRLFQFGRRCAGLCLHSFNPERVGFPIGLRRVFTVVVVLTNEPRNVPDFRSHPCPDGPRSNPKGNSFGFQRR